VRSGELCPAQPDLYDCPRPSHLHTPTLNLQCMSSLPVYPLPLLTHPDRHHDIRQRPPPPRHLPWLLLHDDGRSLPLSPGQRPRRRGRRRCRCWFLVQVGEHGVERGRFSRRSRISNRRREGEVACIFRGMEALRSGWKLMENRRLLFTNSGVVLDQNGCNVRFETNSLRTPKPVAGLMQDDTHEWRGM
jgi:hypothetical protein